MAKKVQVEQIRSVIGCPEWMRVVVRTLGLRKIRHKKIHPDNNAIRGMVKRVPHLVSLTELKE